MKVTIEIECSPGATGEDVAEALRREAHEFAKDSEGFAKVVSSNRIPGLAKNWAISSLFCQYLTGKVKITKQGGQ